MTWKCWFAKVTGFLLILLSVGAFAECRSPTELLKKAQLGDADAQYAIGNSHLSGFGAYQDSSEAWLWFEKAAKQKHVGALYQLGVLTEQRSNDWLSRKLAAKFYSQASRAGHTRAKLALGLIYLSGQGMPQNFRRAEELLGVAADAGEQAAYEPLGELFYLTRDYQQSYKWFVLSSALGGEPARRDEIAEKLNTAQLHEAQKEALGHFTNFHETIPKITLVPPCKSEK